MAVNGVNSLKLQQFTLVYGTLTPITATFPCNFWTLVAPVDLIVQSDSVDATTQEHIFGYVQYGIDGAALRNNAEYYRRFQAGDILIYAQPYAPGTTTAVLRQLV